MKISLYIIVLFFFSMLWSCTAIYIRKKQEVHIPTVNNNVCKKLTGEVVLYAIFVDSKYTGPWSAYDIRSTLDSVHIATQWIEKQAAKAGIKLNIKVDYYQDDKSVVPIEQSLTRKTLSATILGPGGIKNTDKWADKIGKTALGIYGKDTATITKTKIKPKDRERLIAKLRDFHNTDNVGLVYFINNYYTDEISVALHTGSDYSPEYSIVSFKNPEVIAHEFLHLFGALDLYISPFDGKRKAIKRKSFAMKEFPNEIMAFAHRNIDSLEISPLTNYLIGWSNELDPHYKQMIFGKKLKLAKY